MADPTTTAASDDETTELEIDHTGWNRLPDPGMSECCGATEASGHKPWCITVVGYWRWLLFGWRKHG